MITLPFERRWADVPPISWKNGGGVTRELLAWPSASDWSIRISVADIEKNGPFSAFPGVERYFAVLEGEGVELDGVGTVRVGDAPVKFDGETARECRLLGGCTRDLNVMIRRDRGTGLLRMLGEDVGLLPAANTLLHGFFSWPEGHLICEAGTTSLARSGGSDWHASSRSFHFSFSHRNEEPS